MNQLSGHITSIATEGPLSLVGVDVSGTALTAIIVDTPATATWLVTGNPVSVVFKENEVAIATSPLGALSIRNRLHATITSLEMGSLLCIVGLNFAGKALSSVITAQSARDLTLIPGMNVVALIKSNEISLAPL